MSDSCKPPPAASDQAREAAIGHIVCLVKRPVYELRLTVPQACPRWLKWEWALFQVRFRHQYGDQGVSLDLESLLGFYESLRQLMEYIRTEKS